MTEFLILYNAPKALQHNCDDMSKEDMAKIMQSWMKWAEVCGDHLLDLGAPLANRKRLDTSGTTSNSEVGGYSIMQADNVAKIEELLKTNPHLAWGEGCYIEIHEKLPLPKC